MKTPPEKCGEKFAILTMDAESKMRVQVLDIENNTHANNIGEMTPYASKFIGWILQVLKTLGEHLGDTIAFRPDTNAPIQKTSGSYYDDVAFELSLYFTENEKVLANIVFGNYARDDMKLAEHYMAISRTIKEAVNETYKENPTIQEYSIDDDENDNAGENDINPSDDIFEDETTSTRNKSQK